MPEYTPQKTFLKWIEIIVGTLVVESHLLREAHGLSKYVPRNSGFANGVQGVIMIVPSHQRDIVGIFDIF